LDIYQDYLQLARLSLSGRRDDVIACLRQSSRRAKNERPEFYLKLKELLVSIDGVRAPMRSAFKEPGLNQTSTILREIETTGPIDPVWSEAVEDALHGVVAERRKWAQLEKHGLHPTKSILLTGPPGVGKTLTARWLAKALKRRLLVVDLASLVSSQLGRTGANLKAVIEEGASSDCILFLDEFDSISKKRGDEGDVGELKRLVNVLLQALDSWPSSGLLVAATNHPELLDKAVWRRFDRVVDFPSPSHSDLLFFISKLALARGVTIGSPWSSLLAARAEGLSFSEVERMIDNLVRVSIVKGVEIKDLIAQELRRGSGNMTSVDKARVAAAMIVGGVSQRKAAEIMGVSRDTVRKYSSKERV